MNGTYCQGEGVYVKTAFFRHEPVYGRRVCYIPYAFTLSAEIDYTLLPFCCASLSPSRPEADLCPSGNCIFPEYSYRTRHPFSYPACTFTGIYRMWHVFNVLFPVKMCIKSLYVCIGKHTTLLMDVTSKHEQPHSAQLSCIYKVR